VYKNEGFTPHTRNLLVLKEAKSGDPEARQSQLSTIFPDGRKSLGKFGTTGMVDGKRGAIRDSVETSGSFPRLHRMMHSAAGITRSAWLVC
jgi:hypothetical protein